MHTMTVCARSNILCAVESHTHLDQFERRSSHQISHTCVLINVSFAMGDRTTTHTKFQSGSVAGIYSDIQVYLHGNDSRETREYYPLPEYYPTSRQFETQRYSQYADEPSHQQGSHCDTHWSEVGSLQHSCCGNNERDFQRAISG